MSLLANSIDYVLKNEGGFSDDVEDSGGATNFGITHDDMARFLGHSVTTEDVKNMTKDLALKIYLKFYWAPMELDLCNDQNVATAIFDVGVNRGIARSIMYTQSVIGTAQDGRMGPITMCSLNITRRDTFIRTFHGLVVDGYEAIIARKPSQSVFRKGWLARADRLLTLL